MVGAGEDRAAPVARQRGAAPRNAERGRIEMKVWLRNWRHGIEVAVAADTRGMITGEQAALARHDLFCCPAGAGCACRDAKDAIHVETRAGRNIRYHGSLRMWDLDILPRTDKLVLVP